jgi:hypothetical protein
MVSFVNNVKRLGEQGMKPIISPMSAWQLT